jgi:O-glycosyl hydrolase/ankyrin repeat protein
MPRPWLGCWNSWRRRGAGLAGVAASVLVAPAVPVAAAEANVLTIDLDARHQTIEGFGTCYINWTRDRRPEYDDPAFYDTVVYDLGLSLVRQQMQDELEPVNDDGDPHHFRWDGFVVGDVGTGWSFADRMRFLEEFKRRGVTRFLMSPWSPPAFMKTHRASRVGGHLRLDYLAEYAEYMAANIILAKTNHGIDIGYITLQNELLFIEPYHSCVFSPATAREAVRALMRKFAAEGITTRILMPEDMMQLDRMLAYIAPTMSDPETRHFPGDFATHRLGGADVVRAWREQTAMHGRTHWMTETSGHAQTWDGALQMAGDMHDYLVEGDFVAWIYWQITDSERAGVYALMVDGKKTPKYHAAKHYYRFVRPGAVRVSAGVPAAATAAGLRVGAFLHEVDGTLTWVLVNLGSEPATVVLPTRSAAPPEHYEVWLSTAALACAAQPPVAAGGAFTLPPRSLATFVGRSDELRTRDAIDEWPEAWRPPPGDDGAPRGATVNPIAREQTLIGSFTPLHQAVLRGDLPEIERLLAAGADVNARAVDGWSVLHMAAATFQGERGQGGAARWSKYDVLARILREAPDLSATTADGWTALHAAVANAHAAWAQDPEDNVRRVHDLIAAGVPVEARDAAGRTALHWAAWQGFSQMHLPSRADVVEALLAGGAQVDAVDARGRTPLHYAAEMGYEAIVAALMRAGADAAASDSVQQTPLTLAQARELHAVVALLGAHGSIAPVLTAREAGHSPRPGGRLGPELLRAAWDGDEARVRALLAEGADVFYMDSDGFRAIERARDNAHTVIVELLRAAEEAPPAGAEGPR